MKRTHWLNILLLMSFISFLSIGCDDDVKKKKNNDNVNNVNNAVCGNGLLETGETCDGTALGGQDCTTIEGDFTGGTLACAAGCSAFDTSGCVTGCVNACTLDNRVCDGDTLRVCEADPETGCTVWNDTDCSVTSEVCQIVDTVAQCAGCTDACTFNDERCNAGDTGIETCVLGGAGCTVWQNAPCPQTTPDCEVQGGEPVCVSNCTDACTLDAKRCNLAADGIETCANGAAGCTEWQNAACGVATPECQDLAGTPTCMPPNGSGETCSDVYTISIPFYTEGTNFTADFTTADMVLDEESCDTAYYLPEGSDAVFAVDLTAGEAIIFAQGGGLDGTIFLQGVCDSTGACLDAEDRYGDNGTEAILFEAPADGTYYLIVKAFEAVPTVPTYAIAVWHYEDPAELTCDDGFDNDLDGRVDCADPDCFGLGACATELHCGDGEDNDLDGFVDCFDSNCAGVEPCGAEDTEARCSDGVDNDANGLIDCDETACMAFTVCQIGLTCENPLHITTTPFNVTGADWWADHPVNRNYQNSGGGCGGVGSGPDAVFSIDLQAGERITMPETGTFDAVIRVMTTCTNVTPSCLYYSDDPDTGYTFTAPAAGTYFIILEAYYLTHTNTGYNFTVNRIPMNELNCTDGIDNDLDGRIDCNDADCFGQTGCTTELNCSDGLDNDDDGDVDCDDVDCATFIACLGGDSCADALPVTLPFNASGADITADFTNAQTFTGTGCGSASGVEAVFTVALTAGQRIKLDETGALDAVIRVVQPCANATTCLMSYDSPEINLIFTAPADGVYHVILEAWSASPSSRAYNFSIINWDVTETNCTDGLDDDLDGKIDCNDPDCFGATGCTTELNCADGFDNDADGDTDCDDLDCAALSACELGESCANPIVVTTFPYNVTGTNISADYTNDHNYTGAGCGTASGAEAVFAVSLLAGERLKLDETGALDAVIRVIQPCANTTTCLMSQDLTETNLFFTAPTDGTYYVILEAYSSGATSGYNFTIQKFAATETSCVDGIDNDGDGAIDCADSDCLGNPACPAVIYSQDFTGGLPADWAISGTVWAVGTPTAGPASCPSAPNCAGTNLSGNYIANMAWDAHCLRTGNIDLTGLTSATLMFQGWWRAESNWDGGRVEVFTGGTWVNPTTGVTPAYNWLTSTAWSFIDQVWKSHSVNLTPYVGAPVQVRFCFYSDDSAQYAGWFIDNLVVTGN